MSTDRKKTDEYRIHIDSHPRFFDLKLREVWRYRDLILMQTKKNFVIRYKQTVLGPVWLVISPLLTSLMYAFVFGTVAGISTAGVPQLLFYFAGNGIWSYLAGITRNCSGTFSGNAYLFGKVYFPRLAMPVSYMLISAVEYLINLAVLMCFAVFYYYHAGYAIRAEGLLIIPVILIWLGLMGLGLGIILSGLTAKYRDLRILISFGVTLWMYATPVVYPLSQTGNGLIRSLILWNPASSPIELYRRCIFGTGDIYAGSVVFSVVFTAAVLFLGILFFNRIERTFMDTV